MAERVWERFLTEQDRAHLAATAGRRQRPGFGARPALVLVDLYRWVFGDRPEPLLQAVKTWPGNCGPAAWNALPHIQALLAASRQADIPVIHVTAQADIPEWGAFRGLPSRRPLTGEEQENARRKFEIVDELAPLPGESVLHKSAPSAFWGTPLVAYLHHLGVDTVIVSGESTSGCVRATVVDGCTYRFQMVVVEECVFDRHEAPHAINLFDMNQKYADVLPLSETVAYLRSLAANRHVGSAAGTRAR